MKLKNKIENVFNIKGQSTWTTVCPLRYYSQKKTNFLYYRYPRKLQNLDPNSIFFSSINHENFKSFFSPSCFSQNFIRFYDRFRFFLHFFKSYSQKTTFFSTFLPKNSQKLEQSIFKKIITYRGF